MKIFRIVNARPIDQTFNTQITRVYIYTLKRLFFFSFVFPHISKRHAIDYEKTRHSIVCPRARAPVFGCAEFTGKLGTVFRTVLISHFNILACVQYNEVRSYSRVRNTEGRTRVNANRFPVPNFRTSRFPSPQFDRIIPVGKNTNYARRTKYCKFFSARNVYSPPSSVSPGIENIISLPIIIMIGGRPVHRTESFARFLSRITHAITRASADRFSRYTQRRNAPDGGKMAIDSYSHAGLSERSQTGVPPDSVSVRKPIWSRVMAYA